MAAVLVFTGVAIAAVVLFLTLIAAVLSAAFRLILFPLFLLKWIVVALVMLVVGVVFAAAATVFAVVFSVFAVAFSLPLLPLLAVGALLWFLFAKSNRRPAAV